MKKIIALVIGILVAFTVKINAQEVDVYPSGIAPDYTAIHIHPLPISLKKIKAKKTPSLLDFKDAEITFHYWIKLCNNDRSEKIKKQVLEILQTSSKNADFETLVYWSGIYADLSIEISTLPLEILKKEIKNQLKDNKLGDVCVLATLAKYCEWVPGYKSLIPKIHKKIFEIAQQEFPSLEHTKFKEVEIVIH